MWDQTYERCRHVAFALAKQSIGPSTTVGVLALIVPVAYEAHFGIPLAGSMLNNINIRLNTHTIAFLLEHSRAMAVLVDQEFFTLLQEALGLIAEKQGSGFKAPLLVVCGDETCEEGNLMRALLSGAVEYEDFLWEGDPEFKWQPPDDEWQSIALGYTLGTTTSPKGVVLSH